MGIIIKICVILKTEFFIRIQKSRTFMRIGLLNILYMTYSKLLESLETSDVLCLQYLSRANDVEMMLREKHRQVSSDDYGRDEDAADKLLTKHKVSRTSVSTFNTI